MGATRRSQKARPSRETSRELSLSVEPANNNNQGSLGKASELRHAYFRDVVTYLREEIVFNMKEMRTIERLAIAACGAGWAWYIAHRGAAASDFSRHLGLLLVGVSAVGGLRCICLSVYINRAGQYIRDVETTELQLRSGDGRLEGWETRMTESPWRSHLWGILTGILVWLFLIMGNLVLAFELASKNVASPADARASSASHETIE